MCILPELLRTDIKTYAADHSSTSLGCVRMAALVKFLRMSGSSGGMLICWAQYIVSRADIAAIQNTSILKSSQCQL